MAIETDGVEELMKRALRAAAQQAANDIRARAFTPGEVGRNLKDEEFRPLAKGYAAYKARRGRPPVSDQVFTFATASALQITVESPGEVRLGFVTRRKIAGFLQDRNKFWGLTEEERERAVRAAEKVVGAEAASLITITGTAEVPRSRALVVV
jgi:hypothetical protein